MESPVFNFCPQNQTTTTEPGRATGEVVWYDPEAFDNSNEEPKITCIPKSGTRFQIKETDITCTAQDKSGNKAKCSFSVNVKGDEIMCSLHDIV